MRYGLTKEELAYFNDKGFLLVDNALSSRELTTLVKVADDSINGSVAKPGRAVWRSETVWPNIPLCLS